MLIKNIAIVEYQPQKHNPAIFAALENEPQERIIQRYRSVIAPRTIVEALLRKPTQVLIVWDAAQKKVAGWGELHYRNIQLYEKCLFITNPFAHQGLGTLLGVNLINFAHTQYSSDTCAYAGLDNVFSIRTNNRLSSYFSHQISDHETATGTPYRQYIYLRPGSLGWTTNPE